MAHKDSKKTALNLAAIAVAMFGFGYLMVPIYDVLCDITGLNGKTGETTQAAVNEKGIDESRTVTVQFDTNVNRELPWDFKAKTFSVKVHPGEIKEVMFVARNRSSEAVIGQAIPSVAPSKASLYFNKTECFCFNEQLLQAGEEIEMPVRFVVDANLPTSVETLTLSYTFFKSVKTQAEDVAKTKEFSAGAGEHQG